MIDSYDLYQHRLEVENERLMDSNKCSDCLYLEPSPTHEEEGYCVRKYEWIEPIEGNYGCLEWEPVK